MIVARFTTAVQHRRRGAAPGSRRRRSVPIMEDMALQTRAPRRGRRITTIAGLSVVVLLAGWGAASASHAQPTSVDGPAAAAELAADPGKEAQFISRVNSLRASKGL